MLANAAAGMLESKLEAAGGNLVEDKRCEDEHRPSQGGQTGELDETMKNKVTRVIQTILTVMLIWMHTTLQPRHCCTERTACRCAQAAVK